jgi:hypothetical protein
VGEKVTVRHARKEQAQVMRDLHQMQQHRRSQPVSAPAPREQRTGHVTVG